MEDRRLPFRHAGMVLYQANHLVSLYRAMLPDLLENTQMSTSKRSKKFREDKAVEAIIAGIMRGFTKEDWKKVYKRVDEIEAKRKTKRIK